MVLGTLQPGVCPHACRTDRRIDPEIFRGRILFACIAKMAATLRVVGVPEVQTLAQVLPIPAELGPHAPHQPRM